MTIQDNKSITKSATIIGSATILSRILGFIRDIILAAFFGTGIYTQAFVVAFRIPNMLRSVVGEGTTNSVIVPVLSQHLLKHDKKDYWQLAANLINIMFFSTLVVTAIGIIIAPFIVKVIAPGFINEANKFAITVKLTRIMFPYIFFIGLTSISIGILNSFKYFKMPALSQATFNFLFIISIAIFYYVFNMGVFSLAIGVLIGGLGQLMIQIPSLYRYGFRLNKKVFGIHPAIRNIAKLFIPRLIGAGVYHINILVDTMLASLSFIVGKGAVAALYFSNRLVQFPLAIFGIALAQAVLPTFSRQSLEENLDKFKETLGFSLRSVFFITIPSSIGLIILKDPIVKILFQRGQFDQYSSNITSFALLFYALGLFAYAGIKILVSSFYSLKDTSTPVKIASLSVVVNIVLNLLLMKPLKVGGLALATSISAMLNFILLYYALSKKIGNIHQKDTVVMFLKAAFSSVIMGLICYWFFYLFCISFIGTGLIKESIGIFLTLCLGASSYLVICFLMKMQEARRIIKFVKAKIAG